MYLKGDRIYVRSNMDGRYTGEIIKASAYSFMGQFLTVRLDIPVLHTDSAGQEGLIRTRVLRADNGSPLMQKYCAHVIRLNRRDLDKE